MVSSRNRRARLWCAGKGLFVGSLCAASLLRGAAADMPVHRDPAEPPAAVKGGLRPAAIRPVVPDASVNPYATSPEALQTSPKSAPIRIQPPQTSPPAAPIVQRASTTPPPANEPSRRLPKPAVIENIFVTPPAAPLLIINDAHHRSTAPGTIVNESLNRSNAPRSINSRATEPAPFPQTAAIEPAAAAGADESQSELAQPPELPPIVDSKVASPRLLLFATEEENLPPIVPASAARARRQLRPTPPTAPQQAAPDASSAQWQTPSEDPQARAETAAAMEPSIEASAESETVADNELPVEASPLPLLLAHPASPVESDGPLPPANAPQLIPAEDNASPEFLSDETAPPAGTVLGSPTPWRSRVARRDVPMPQENHFVQSDAQDTEPTPAANDRAADPPPAAVERAPLSAPAVLPEGSPFETIGESGTLSVQVRRSLLLRTQKDIFRTAVVDETICEIVQFTPRELSIIGRSQGSTHVTFWFDDPAMQPVTYVVEVRPDAAEIKKEEEKYLLLEDVLNEMFPDSKIKLTLVADKLIVRGQAKDSEEAFQILTIIRAQTGYRAGWPAGVAGPGINEGQAAQVLADSATGTSRRTNYQVVNMLRVPGVQQVALRVKIAELNRSAARNFGLDVSGSIDIGDSSKILLNSLSSVTTAGQAPPILFNIDGDDISVGLNTLQQHGVVKLLSEPTLVTLSGRPATFLAGGEFAVPTAVGLNGLSAATTDFRAFGAIISFLPTVVDKDRVRLEVSPEFSEISQDAQTTVNGIPGLNVRAATTTVEMREGQTLAIAGLLQDSMTANNAGDLPFIQRIIGRRSVARNENELIILVTPELVHPMEPEEVPPLPGFDVTEPTNAQFYLHGDLEGNPTMDYRSTVWPRLKKRYKAGGSAMTSGPFGHGQ